jgi:hypothetical protein
LCSIYRWDGLLCNLNFIHCVISIGCNFFTFLIMIFFCREHDKKVCILGLVSLLPLQAEILPQELHSGLDQVFKAVLKMLVSYKEQLEGILILV